MAAEGNSAGRRGSERKNFVMIIISCTGIVKVHEIYYLFATAHTRAR